MRSALSFDDWRSQGHLSHIIQTLYDKGAWKWNFSPFKEIRTDVPTNRQSFDKSRTDQPTIFDNYQIHLCWMTMILWYWKNNVFQNKAMNANLQVIVPNINGKKANILENIQGSNTILNKYMQCSFIQTIFVHPNNVHSSKQCSIIQTLFIHPNNDPTWLGAGWRHNESCRVLRFTQGSSNQ